MLTKKDIDAIRFYQGDIRKRMEDGSFSEKQKETGFYGIASAYKTMNCLMFDGIDNEKERIAEGGACLKPLVFMEIDKVAEVFCDIFRAMCRSARAEGSPRRVQTVYRTDRGISVREMQRQGKTISFTSTSKENSPGEYFLGKKKLTLLEIVMPPDIPHLDFEEVLGGDYYYKGQKEILLPPFLRASFREGKLTKEEEGYRDADGQPPQGKYIVVLEGMDLPEPQGKNQEYAVRLEELERDKAKMAEFLEKLIHGKAVTKEEEEEYCAWKKNFRELITEAFRTIQNGSGAGTDSLQDRRERLMKDVQGMIQEFDKRRGKYRRLMGICNWLLAFVSVAPLVCMALSFMQEYEVLMKVVAIVTSAGALFLTHILKAQVYHLKLYQRTKTCLRLRDLRRQMNFEPCWDEEKMKEYVGTFRTIMKEDTDMSLQNLQQQIEYEGELYQDEMIPL